MPVGVKRARQDRSYLARTTWDDDFHVVPLLLTAKNFACIPCLAPVNISKQVYYKCQPKTFRLQNRRHAGEGAPQAKRPKASKQNGASMKQPSSCLPGRGMKRPPCAISPKRQE